MTRNEAFRRLLLVVVGLLLLWIAWTGWSGGLTQWSQARGAGQVAQTITQFAFGTFAFLSLVTTVWAVSSTLAAGLASVVWGETSQLIGVLSGAGGLAVALVIAWLVRVGARGLTRVCT